MPVRIAVIGMGSVGRGILSSLSKSNPGLVITAVADSRSGCISPDGIDPAELLTRKQQDGICGIPRSMPGWWFRLRRMIFWLR